MKGKVIILCGVSGSGKSTMAAAEWPDSPVYSADHYCIVGNEYQFWARNLPEAHACCLRQFAQAVAHPIDRPGWDTLVVDNTNTTVAEVAPYAALAQAYGWDLQVIILRCDWRKAAKRQVHGVPRDTVRAQAHRLAYLPSVLPPRWPTRIVEAN